MRKDDAFVLFTFPFAIFVAIFTIFGSISLASLAEEAFGVGFSFIVGIGFLAGYPTFCIFVWGKAWGKF